MNASEDNFEEISPCEGSADDNIIEETDHDDEADGSNASSSKSVAVTVTSSLPPGPEIIPPAEPRLTPKVNSDKKKIAYEEPLAEKTPIDGVTSLPSGPEVLAPDEPSLPPEMVPDTKAGMRNSPIPTIPPHEDQSSSPILVSLESQSSVNPPPESLEEDESIDMAPIPERTEDHISSVGAHWVGGTNNHTETSVPDEDQDSVDLAEPILYEATSARLVEESSDEEEQHQQQQDQPLNVSVAVAEEPESVKNNRIANGLCPTCGVALFRMRNSLMGMRSPFLPITEEGIANNGRCLRCHPDVVLGPAHETSDAISPDPALVLEGSKDNDGEGGQKQSCIISCYKRTSPKQKIAVLLVLISVVVVMVVLLVTASTGKSDSSNKSNSNDSGDIISDTKGTLYETASWIPTSSPSTFPSAPPRTKPLDALSVKQSMIPTGIPSTFPSALPTTKPSRAPTKIPSNAPTKEAATFALESSNLVVGDDIVFTFENGPATGLDWVGIYTNPGYGPANGQRIRGSLVWLFAGVDSNGSVIFNRNAPFEETSNWPLPAGNYIAYFLENDGYVSIAPPVPFSIDHADDAPTFKLNKSTYLEGENIIASFTNGPATGDDSLTLYRYPGNAPTFGTRNGASLMYLRTAKSTGSVTFSRTTVGDFDTWPLPPGNYVACFLQSNGYLKLAPDALFSIIADNDGLLCQDDHDSCSHWASIGECEANPAYMLDYCKSSCSVCSVTAGSTNQQTTTMQPSTFPSNLPTASKAPTASPLASSTNMPSSLPSINPTDSASDLTTFMLDKSNYVMWESIVANFSNGPATGADYVAIYTNPGYAPTNGIRNGKSLLYLYTDSDPNGSVIFDSNTVGSESNWPLPAGNYVACYLENDGYEKIAPTVPFTVENAGDAPTFTLDKSNYLEGENIVVSFTNGPATGADYIAIYTDTGNAPTYGVRNGGTTLFLYVGGVSDGTVTFGNSTVGDDSDWPLVPGNYVACFLLNDGYLKIAPNVLFVVTG